MKIKVTEKAYFKKYYKKITLQYNKAKKLPKWSYGNTRNDPLYSKYKESFKNCVSEQTKLYNTGIDCRISAPYNSGIIFIYYNDDDIEKHISNKFSIIEKHMPLEKQVELQSLETNSIIRKKYFFSKYKYKLHFKLTDRKWYDQKAKEEKRIKYNEILKYFHDSYKDNFDDKVKAGNYMSINPILYVLDEDDVFYLKLIYGDDIIKIDMVILIDDVV